MLNLVKAQMEQVEDPKTGQMVATLHAGAVPQWRPSRHGRTQGWRIY
jgi:hypothetical protein